jgi:hypothetical protein
MGAQENRFLKLNPEVILTPVIEPVIVACDPFFEALPRHVTSGLRTPDSQLEVVRHYAQELQVEFPELTNTGVHSVVQINMDGVIRSLYGWQRSWSMILNKGDLVAPPLDAEALFDYISNAANKKGRSIPCSPHIKGLAFDIGCRGTTPEVVSAIMFKALAANVPGLHSVQVEHNQGCVHVNCRVAEA